MNKYAFILGRKHLLSIAELAQFLKEENILETNNEALIAKLDPKFSTEAKADSAPSATPSASPSESPFDFQAILNRLGGTIKIAEIFEEIPSSQKDTIAHALANHIQEKFEGVTSKIIYGISAYNLKQRHDQFLRRTLKKVKIQLVDAGFKSRFINKNFTNPENAALKGEKILQEGVELVVIEGRTQFYLAETKALQDFEGYSKRDYDRPARDPRLGMLPPKLCQIMLNLSGVSSDPSQNQTPPKTIYDPFCGIGTVLTEALNMGFNVIGSDIEPVVIEKSQTNIEYVKQLQSGPNRAQFPSASLFVQDATQLIARDLPAKIDAIVTESYLGPPVSKMPIPENVEKTFDNIKALIFGFLKAVGKIIKPGTPIVISVPVYRDHQKFHFIEGLSEIIPRLGYDTEPLIPDQLAQREGLRMFQRPTLVYDRPDQIVGREIWKLVKK
ncbi:MAG: hypothetical protein WC843_06690 [Candidatus Gracilibacteria bacterium]|jgi:tRNA G10  N-methylase Trm11